MGSSCYWRERLRERTQERLLLHLLGVASRDFHKDAKIKQIGRFVVFSAQWEAEGNRQKMVVLSQHQRTEPAGGRGGVI